MKKKVKKFDVGGIIAQTPSQPVAQTPGRPAAQTPTFDRAKMDRFMQIATPERRQQLIGQIKNTYGVDYTPPSAPATSATSATSAPAFDRAKMDRFMRIATPERRQQLMGQIKSAYGIDYTPPGMKKGGSVKDASKRADGIAQRGKTKGKMY